MKVSPALGRACSEGTVFRTNYRLAHLPSFQASRLCIPASNLVPVQRRSSFATASTPVQHAQPRSQQPAIALKSTKASNFVTSFYQIRRNAHAYQPKAAPTATQTQDLTNGLDDAPLVQEEGSDKQVDWSRSFHGLSSTAFPPEAVKILSEPIEPEDIEVKPDGLLYLPEIKYRRILNKAFGPGAWGLAPRGPTIVTAKSVTREYGMVVQSRLVSIARGEQAYFDPENIPTATEGCKSNALMRCCKDLGIASELWDPRFIRKFIAENVKETWVEHAGTGKRRKVFLRNGEKVQYPYKEVGSVNNAGRGLGGSASTGRTAGQR